MAVLLQTEELERKLSLLAARLEESEAENRRLLALLLGEPRDVAGARISGPVGQRQVADDEQQLSHLTLCESAGAWAQSPSRVINQAGEPRRCHRISREGQGQEEYDRESLELLHLVGRAPVEERRGGCQVAAGGSTSEPTLLPHPERAPSLVAQAKGVPPAGSTRRKRGPNGGAGESKEGKQRHIALQLMYLGAGFHGFASQGGPQRTVESEVFAALRRTRLLLAASPEEARYSRCGRTDKGVSARGQVIALHLRSNVGQTHEQTLPIEEQEDEQQQQQPRQQKRPAAADGDRLEAAHAARTAEASVSSSPGMPLPNSPAPPPHPRRHHCQGAAPGWWPGLALRASASQHLVTR
eukprot:jgi/Mesen1/10310/ME000079S09731